MVETIKIEADLQLDEQSVFPDIGENIFHGDGFASQGVEISVAASAADQAVDMSQYGDIQAVVIIAPIAAVANISVKVNSTGQQAFTVSPLVEFSQQVTALYFSNASTTARKVRIYPTGVE